MVVKRSFLFLALSIVTGELTRLVLRACNKKSRKIKTEKQFGGLESLVSFSGCLIAANRAVESERPDAYIRDPLAAGLCGEEALAARRNVDQSQQEQQQAASEDKQPATAPRRFIPRLIMRTKFFDDVVSLVTWRGEGPAAELAGVGCHAALLAACRAVPAPCLQVVLLGSGLDARPWRLELPPGVRWFEVDRPTVLEAKRSRLRALGAQLEADQKKTQRQAQVTPTPSPAAAAAADGGGGGGAGGGGGYHPLRSSSWHCCPADLQLRGWSRGLLELGLDPMAPVLWVLEGLLYYLEEQDVRAVLQEAASVSGPGSVLAASVLRAQSCDPNNASGAWPASRSGSVADIAGTSFSPGTGTATGQLAAAGEVATDGGSGTSGAGPAADMAGTIAAAAPLATAAPANAPAGARMIVRAPVGAVTGGATAGGAQEQPAGQTHAGSRTGDSRTYRLANEFKWKCAEEVPQFLASCAWHATAALSWVEAARSYGLPALNQVSGVHFTTATLEP